MKMNMAENQKVQIDEMMREKREKTVLMVMWRTTVMNNLSASMRWNQSATITGV